MDKLSMNSIGVWVMWKREFCKSSSAWRDRNRVAVCVHLMRARITSAKSEAFLMHSTGMERVA